MCVGKAQVQLRALLQGVQNKAVAVVVAEQRDSQTQRTRRGERDYKTQHPRRRFGIIASVEARGGKGALACENLRHRV
jgi:hypothetical protein